MNYEGSGDTEEGAGKMTTVVQLHDGKRQDKCSEKSDGDVGTYWTEGKED